MARVRRTVGARPAGSLAVLLAVAGAVRLACAEPAWNGAPAWLSGYRAAPTCPDARVFLGAVERRRSAAAGDERIRVSVEITASAEPAAYAGVIEIVDGPEHTRRVVAGAECGEVAEALSLIAAMGLDAGERSGAVEDASSAAAPAPAESDDGAMREPSPVGAGAHEELVLGIGALAVAHGAAAPGAAWGVGGALAVEWLADAWQPALLVSAFRATGDDVQLAGGTAHARFELLAAAAQLCPLRFPVHGRWALRPCLELELGQLSGTSSGAAVRGATTRSGVWSSAGVGVRGDADVWGPLRVSASVGAVAPLARHEYTFSPDTTTAFQVPALSLRATAWLGVLF